MVASGLSTTQPMRSFTRAGDGTQRQLELR
jgi:hypothetical protein